MLFTLYFECLRLLFNSFQKQKTNGTKHFACVAAHDFSLFQLRAAEDLGKDLAEQMIKEGAGNILNEAKRITAEEIMRQKAEKERKMLEEQSKEQSTENGHKEVKS